MSKKKESQRRLITETWEQIATLCVKEQAEIHFGLNSELDSGEANRGLLLFRGGYRWIILEWN